jgi:hypothetical protein
MIFNYMDSMNTYEVVVGRHPTSESVWPL